MTVATNTCKTCGAVHDGGDVNECRGCWYQRMMAEATERFAPITAAVEAAGWETQVWQTGGMVICLAGRPQGADNDDWEAGPHAMWSDPEDAPMDDGSTDFSFGVYVDNTEDNCTDGVYLFGERATLADLTWVLTNEWPAIVAASSRTDDMVHLHHHPKSFAVIDRDGRFLTGPITHRAAEVARDRHGNGAGIVVAPADLNDDTSRYTDRLRGALHRVTIAGFGDNVDDDQIIYDAATTYLTHLERE